LYLIPKNQYQQAMRTNLYILFLTVLTCSPIFGQITVQNITIPKVGDTLRTATDNLPSNITITNPGANQTWDFSNLVAPFVTETVLLPPSEGMSAFQFPTATYMIKQTDNAEFYFRNTNNQTLQLGFTGEAPGGLGINILAKYVPPQIDKQTPMSYGDQLSSSTSIDIPFSSSIIPDSILNQLPIRPDSIRISATFAIETNVDAWGKLTIPGGTYDVLRQKRTTIANRKLEIKAGLSFWIDVTSAFPLPGITGLDTTVVYEFWSNVAKEAIAIVSVSEPQSTQATSVQFKADSNVITSAYTKPTTKTGNIHAYPNPAIGSVRFDIVGLTPGNYTVKIINILGMSVWSEKYYISGSRTVRVELDNFKRGTYLYALINDKGRTITTKRLIVLKP
jgi:hypothetical protein